MPVYLCRWLNGDASFVWASNRDNAEIVLDEIDNAEGCPFRIVREFMAHFHLTDDGKFEFESFGETTEDTLDKAYPLLRKAENPFYERDDLTPEQLEIIREAVIQERKSVKLKETRQPNTQLGRDIKRKSDMPTAYLERIIEQVASERLAEWDDPDSESD